MTKKYKIDFNNGKVFEATMSEEYYMVETPDVNLTEDELLSLGATITEIEEPRRSFWVCWNDWDYLKVSSVGPISDKENVIHVTELREGEVIVSREKLGLAWDKNLKGFPRTTFHNFCKELGLGE
jgi:hypothetical protein